ncbi:unnamed protein product [Rotaria socialis]|uniref:Uncharacterized protein n=1 Tax=Rotaria socialis TaxID=392032 RepID=A0A820VZ44_9BILA|nr:unnamed protein product [Rotaria socialis]CAF3477979.1 unnamed protein product [Rotaria socialis]CAF3575617.1 unnamed protein product [Rotaria socialis]CAF4288580.1 unnamed protein product [Rotaria socialis]CAF4508780.1 unnamed protein product [Rotaria socialis]
MLLEVNRALTAPIPRTSLLPSPSTITRILNTGPPPEATPTSLQPAKPPTITPYTRFIMERIISSSNPAIAGVLDVGGVVLTDNEDNDGDEDSLLMATWTVRITIIWARQAPCPVFTLAWSLRPASFLMFLFL